MARAAVPARTNRLDGQSAERLRVALVSFLARRTGDRVLAEDLAQESLVRVLAGLPRFRGTAALRTWARRIALNVWHDHLRRRGASPAERAAAGDQFSVGALLDALGPTPPGPPPEEAYDRHATHDCLLAAARLLPIAEREIVLLHDLGAIQLEQAAASLGCSLGAAKVRLHRGRRHLAEICRGDCASETGPEGATLCTPKAAAAPRATNARALQRTRKRRK